MRPVWDRGFFLGSLVIAFVQGAAIGAMVQELHVVDGRYVGGGFRLGDAFRNLLRYRRRTRLRAARLWLVLKLRQAAAAATPGNCSSGRTHALAASFWPYMIPYSITVENAAAPPQSLEFFFWGGGLVVFPIVIYTAAVFWIFRGKVGEVAQGYGA
jgi:cytochrome bd-type quinol oxidase subunit 2